MVNLITAQAGPPIKIWLQNFDGGPELLPVYLSCNSDSRKDEIETIVQKRKFFLCYNSSFMYPNVYLQCMEQCICGDFQ